MRLIRLQQPVVLLLAALTGFALASAPCANAQTYASVHGTVTDPTGAVISGASATALNTATGISTLTKTDKNGYYILPQLQVGGPYTVTIESPGFQSSVTTGLTLNVNDNREVDAKMKLGTSSQTVEVSATAVQVETSNTQLQQIVTAEQLESIPLEGRDPDGLQKLQPGVVESSDETGSYSANGSQTPQNSYMLNGTDINDGPLQDEGIYINPDALQEENIVTSTMNPEFARNSGAVVNQILKSGTNEFHGSGFEFYRDTFMNNGNYFSATRPVFHQNLYGGTLGGPIIKKKLFFFVAYQGERNRTGQTTLQPTLTGTKGASATGDFAGDFASDTSYAMTDPTTGQPLALNQPFDNTVVNPDTGTVTCPSIPHKVYSESLSCNTMPASYALQLGFITHITDTPPAWIQAYDNGSVGVTPATIKIPTANWDSIASNLINTYVPQATNGTNYNFNALNTAAQDQGIERLDYTPTAKDSIWASNVFQSSPSYNTLPFLGSSFPGFAQVNTEHYKIFSASWTHTFNSNMLNELRAGYFRFNYPSVVPAQAVQPSTLGFNITPQSSQSGAPFISVGSIFDLGFSPDGPQPRTDTNLSYGDNFTWVKGDHNLKFGGNFEQFRVHNVFGADNNGSYSFNGGGTYSSGDPILDFALGIPDRYTQTSDGVIDAVAEEYFVYAQDNWKMTHDLTVNYGIAWDTEVPNQNRQFGGLGITCWQNSSATSNVFAGGPPGLTWPGDPGCNAAGGPTTHFDHFGPRVGFAWSPSKGPAKLIGTPDAHELSIRAGFGLFYNRDMEEQSLQNLGDPPFFFQSNGAADFGGSPSFANPFMDIGGGGSESNPFPYPAPHVGDPFPSNIAEMDLAAFDKSYGVPYAYNFNLNIQRALPYNMIVQIGYVGSIGHRLSTWYEGDPITPIGHAACLADSAGCAADAQNIHLDYPQYTAQPTIVPGTATEGSAGTGIPWYLSVAEQNTEGSSNYNAFQASLIKAPSHGLQFTVAYTWSHALDNFSGYESGSGGSSGYGNYGRVYNYVPGFSYLNYGDSDYDARQRLSTSYVYSVPVMGFLKHNLIAREALAGWGFSGVTALQSGFPVGISEGTQRSLWCDSESYFGCGDVPQRTGAPIKRYNPRTMPTGSGGLQYFDTSSFSSEPLGTFGNTGRNFFHGPGFNYTNLSVTKIIHFTSDAKRYVQLRLEAFNAFNHANFSAPNGIFISPTFGQITGVDASAEGNGDPAPGRDIQLAGKIYF